LNEEEADETWIPRAERVGIFISLDSATAFYGKRFIWKAILTATKKLVNNMAKKIVVREQRFYT